MGSPVSVNVAEIVMQNIAEQALETYKQTCTTALSPVVRKPINANPD